MPYKISFVLARLSVPVQVIDWKDSSLTRSAGLAISYKLMSALEWCRVSVATRTCKRLSTIGSCAAVLLFDSDLTLSQSTPIKRWLTSPISWSVNTTALIYIRRSSVGSRRRYPKITSAYISNDLSAWNSAADNNLPVDSSTYGSQNVIFIYTSRERTNSHSSAPASSDKFSSQ